jgi:anthranilate phosphoribosyltransferase
MFNQALRAPIAQTTPDFVPSTAAEEGLNALLAGRDLSRDESHALFAALVGGALDDAAMAAVFVALRLKGETAEELIGAARALREADAPFPRPDYRFADSCGTGGDGSGSINVSTSVAFVAAAAGLPVAKHGNRSFTSRCGSADVLEALGARIDLPADQSRRILDEIGACFLFAPQYHPGLRHAGPVRRRLKVRTVMNLLGPCLNPAEPTVQLLGVADPALLEPIARTLASLGVQDALVVHGSGLDEIALHGPTSAVRLRRGALEPLDITPEGAGVARAAPGSARGGEPIENAARLRALLEGCAPAAEADLVAINAGALLMTAGLTSSIREGTQMASEIIASGRAARVLAAFVEASNG